MRSCRPRKERRSTSVRSADRAVLRPTSTGPCRRRAMPTPRPARCTPCSGRRRERQWTSARLAGPGASPSRTTVGASSQAGATTCRARSPLFTRSFGRPRRYARSGFARRIEQRGLRHERSDPRRGQQPDGRERLARIFMNAPRGHDRSGHVPRRANLPRIRHQRSRPSRGAEPNRFGH